ncbi:MAG: hypothetical protein CVT47_02645 [Thermoplasmata archaeon HGW-Thermoplasmata-2]|nr:MAG: hypothetical protein CVT47_02645 [Thermoplasmata archaeon HGW-Thermoplasmata-2]
MNSGKAPYEIWEHTADIGILAHGKTLEELFCNAALGMFDIICGKVQRGESAKKSGAKAPATDQRRSIDLSARVLDSLMVDWLSELLYLFSAFRFFGAKYEIKVKRTAHGSGGWQARGEVEGATYDRKKHGYGADVKAVTYHMLEVKQENEEWTARVLFDI